jgi:fructokinase
MLIGAIEGGGTKFICAIALFDPDDSAEKKPEIIEQIRIPTEGPEVTLAAASDFFRAAQDGRRESRQGLKVRGGLNIEALGLGMFGPVECDTRSPRWGYLLNTPKPRWSDIDVAYRLQRELGVPVRLETDVAAAALGEWKWGAGRGAKVCVYVTVGTGIGAGILVDGAPLRGHFHPEVGHMRVPKIVKDLGAKASGGHSSLRGRGESAGSGQFADTGFEDEKFKGVCIHHGDCLEGLASGPAIKARWGIAPEDLPADHPAWRLEAEYLALAFSNIALTVAPDRIIVGGGIGLHDGLLDMVAERMNGLLGGYIQALDSADAIRRYIARAELGADAGILGAAQLGREAARP